MILELQIDSEAFCKNFREQLRRALACQLVEHKLDLIPNDGKEGEPIVVTGYTVGETRLRFAKTPTDVCIHSGDPRIATHRPVHRPQIVQSITVHFSNVKDLVAANTAKAPTATLHPSVVFDVSIDTCNNMRVLCFHYAGLDEGFDESALGLNLGEHIHSVCTWLPIEQILAEYMPEDVELVNAHCTMTELRTCLVIRMEFWGPDWGAATGDAARSIADWDAFYAKRVIDRLGSAEERADWSLFVDQHALCSYVRKTLIESIEKKKGELTITRYPVTGWFPWFPLPGNEASRIRAVMEVQQKDACYCFTEDLDVTGEIVADILISVPAENTLRIDVYVDVTADFWDASCCVATVALFWPIMGYGQYATGKLSSGEFALTLLPLVAVIGALLKIGEAGSDFPPPAGFVKDEENDNHVFREQKLALPDNPGFGKMTLKGSKPLRDDFSLRASGLLIFGGLHTYERPKPVLQDPVLEPFCWGKTARCSRRVGASTRIRLNPEDPRHWSLLRVCQVRVIDDPLNVFKVEVQHEPNTLPDVIVRVDFWGMNADYWKSEHRYPCRLMLKTTGGVRILTLPPLPELTQEQFETLQLGIQIEYVNDCYLPRHRIFEELEWPIEVLIGQPGLHYWQVHVTGMNPGERVELLDERNRVVGTFVVNRAGVLRANALGTIAGQRLNSRTADEAAPHADAPPVLRLRRLTSAPVVRSIPALRTMLGEHGDLKFDGMRLTSLKPASSTPICGPAGQGSAIEMFEIKHKVYPDVLLQHRDAKRDVNLRQTALAERAPIRLARPCLAIAAASGERNGHALLLAVMPGIVEAYDVSNASEPRRAGAWRAQNVRGAVEFAGRAILWSANEIWPADSGPATPEPFSRCDAAEIQGVAVVQDRLFVARGDELVEYDRNLCERSRTRCRALQLASAGGGYLAVREEAGVRFVDIERGSPEEGRLVPVCGVQHIEAPAVPFRHAIYVRGPQGGFLMDPSGEYLAEYPGRAWFEGIVRVGKLLAIRDEHVIRLLEATASVQSE